MGVNSFLCIQCLLPLLDSVFCVCSLDQGFLIPHFISLSFLTFYLLVIRVIRVTIGAVKISHYHYKLSISPHRFVNFSSCVFEATLLFIVQKTTILFFDKLWRSILFTSGNAFSLEVWIITHRLSFVYPMHGLSFTIILLLIYLSLYFNISLVNNINCF